MASISIRIYGWVEGLYFNYIYNSNRMVAGFPVTVLIRMKTIVIFYCGYVGGTASIVQRMTDTFSVSPSPTVTRCLFLCTLCTVLVVPEIEDLPYIHLSINRNAIAWDEWREALAPSSVLFC